MHSSYSFHSYLWQAYVVYGLPWWTQMVKNLPTMWETWVQYLGQEDPLEKEMATHSSILALRIPWTEELGGLHTVHGVAKCQTQRRD